MNMEGYYSEVKEVALEGFKRLNDTTQVEQKKWEVPVGSWEVSVVRGKVLEKATLSRIRLNAKNPLTGEDTRLDVVQAKVYPASPRIPILLFNVENRATREDHLAGFLDVIPVAARKEDLRFLAGEIKKVTERHGEDYEPLRSKIENMYKMDHWEKAINAAIGIRLELANEQFDLVTCVSVLEHMSDDDKLKGITEMSRVLKKGGRLIITFDKEGQRDLVAFIRQASGLTALRVEQFNRPGNLVKKKGTDVVGIYLQKD